MDVVTYIVVMVLLSGALSAAARLLGMLTLGGAVASFLIGMVVGVFGGLEWFILLMLFVAAGFAATKIGFSDKRAKGLQEGVHGERTHLNILGVGVAPCIMAVIAFLAGDDHRMITSIGFIASISVAAADTLASEIGVMDKDVWLCTNLTRVSPGTDGGVSVIGSFAALCAAAVTSVLGWLVLYRTLDVLLIIPIAAGMAGCYLDSVFGATVEAKGLISKYTNNALTSLLGAVIAICIAWPFV